MGYYTEFSLEIETNRHPLSEIMKAIKEDEDTFYGIERPTVHQLEDNTPYQNCCLGTYTEVKWYNEEADMIEFSKRFPAATFTVEGHGEEEGDIWRHRYRNGNVMYQHAIIVWTDWEIKI